MIYMINNKGINAFYRQCTEFLLPMYNKADFTNEVLGLISEISEDDIKKMSEDASIITLNIVHQLTKSGNEEVLELDLNEDYTLINEDT